MSGYGKVWYEGKQYTLTEEAWCENYCGEACYFAHALRGGRKYLVRWEITDAETEEPEFACDWDEPADVEPID